MDFCLSIGLDDYIKLTPPTPYAENDAKSFDHVIKIIYEAEYTSLIVGNNATYLNVEHTVQDIASKIEPDDRFFMFYAGHGENIRAVVPKIWTMC